jgi:hypothetical protein
MTGLRRGARNNHAPEDGLSGCLLGSGKDRPPWACRPLHRGAGVSSTLRPTRSSNEPGPVGRHGDVDRPHILRGDVLLAVHPHHHDAAKRGPVRLTATEHDIWAAGHLGTGLDDVTHNVCNASAGSLSTCATAATTGSYSARKSLPAARSHSYSQSLPPPCHRASPAASERSAYNASASPPPAPRSAAPQPSSPSVTRWPQPHTRSPPNTATSTSSSDPPYDRFGRRAAASRSPAARPPQPALCGGLHVGPLATAEQHSPGQRNRVGSASLPVREPRWPWRAVAEERTQRSRPSSAPHSHRS